MISPVGLVTDLIVFAPSPSSPHILDSDCQVMELNRRGCNTEKESYTCSKDNMILIAQVHAAACIMWYLQLMYLIPPLCITNMIPVAHVYNTHAILIMFIYLNIKPSQQRIWYLSKTYLCLIHYCKCFTVQSPFLITFITKLFGILPHRSSKICVTNKYFSRIFNSIIKKFVA
jgi:hypothetical protein